MPATSIKIVLGDDVRRFSVESMRATFGGECTLDGIRRIIRKSFADALGDANMRITYQDEDGDTITITSQIEFEEAFNVMNNGHRRVIRFTITPLDDPSPGPTTQPEEQGVDTGGGGAAAVAAAAAAAVAAAGGGGGAAGTATAAAAAGGGGGAAAAAAAGAAAVAGASGGAEPTMATRAVGTGGWVDEEGKVEWDSEKAVHSDVSCDGCGMYPIVGVRYKCAVRKNFDLCEICETKDKSPYPYLKIKVPGQSPLAIVALLRPDQPGDADDAISPETLSQLVALASPGRQPVAQPPAAEEEDKRSHPEAVTQPCKPGDEEAGCSQAQAAAESPKPAVEPDEATAPPTLPAPPAPSPAIPSPTSARQESMVFLDSVASTASLGPFRMRRTEAGHCTLAVPAPAGKGVCSGVWLLNDGQVELRLGDEGCELIRDYLDRDEGIVRLTCAAHRDLCLGVKGPREMVGLPVKASAPATLFRLRHAPPSAPMPSMAPLSSSPPPPYPVASPPLEIPADPYLKACFVADVTIPDGTQLVGGTKVNKTWRMRNDGDQPFPAGCRLMFEGGERFAGPVDGVPVSRIQPLQEFNVTVPLVVPPTPGSHVSNWRLHAPSGRPFGSHCWVQVTTAAQSPTLPPTCSNTTTSPVSAAAEEPTLGAPPAAAAAAAQVAATEDSQEFLPLNPLLDSQSSEGGGVDPAEFDSKLEKWRPAVQRLTEFGFTDMNRMVFVLERTASPETWEHKLNDVITALVG